MPLNYETPSDTGKTHRASRNAAHAIALFAAFWTVVLAIAGFAEGLVALWMSAMTTAIIAYFAWMYAFTGHPFPRSKRNGSG